MLFSHAGWVRNPGREGGQRREGRARMYFPEMTFPWLLCSAVINRRSSPAGSARCGGDRWDERTKSESRWREVSYTIITSVCAARVSISAEARGRGGRRSGWIIAIILRLNFSPFPSSSESQSEAIQPVFRRFHFFETLLTTLSQRNVGRRMLSFGSTE